MSILVKLNYISPISKIKFDNQNENILVIIGTINNNLTCRIIRNLNLDNINEKIKGYGINEILKINKKLENPEFEIKLFQYNHKTNFLSLLFKNTINFNNLDTHIILYPVTKHSLKILKLSNDSYLYECFDQSLINKNSKSKCIIFLSETQNIKSPEVKLNIINIDQTKDTFIKNRYSSIYFKELELKNISTYKTFIDRYFSRNKLFNQIIKSYKDTPEDVKRFITNFQINLDLASITKNNLTSINKFIKRTPIKKNKYIDPYKNNILNMCIDGRILKFDILKKNSQIIENKYLQILSKTLSPEILENFSNGSGYIIRTALQDRHYLDLPYEGDIINIITKDNRTIIYVENEYYMSPNVLERDQFSVAYKKCLLQSEECRLKPQLNKKLKYYLILNGDFELSKTKDILGYFNKGEPLITLLCNHPIKFSKDIETNTNSQIETYIRNGDKIGEIQ